MNLEANLHSLLSFAWTLTRPTNFNLLRQNIVFSYSQRKSVSFSWLIDYFSFFFCYFTLLLIFTKIILKILLLFYYIFFHENYFYFFMFRDVPECSGMFHVPGFIDARLVMVYNIWKNIFNSSGDHFRHNFCVNVYERDWTPVLNIWTNFSFFSIRVITACFWEQDISPFSKLSFTHLRKGSLIKGHNTL